VTLGALTHRNESPSSYGIHDINQTNGETCLGTAMPKMKHEPGREQDTIANNGSDAERIRATLEGFKPYILGLLGSSEFLHPDGFDCLVFNATPTATGNRHRRPQGVFEFFLRGMDYPGARRKRYVSDQSAFRPHLLQVIRELLTAVEGTPRSIRLRRRSSGEKMAGSSAGAAPETADSGYCRSPNSTFGTVQPQSILTEVQSGMGDGRGRRQPGQGDAERGWSEFGQAPTRCQTVYVGPTLDWNWGNVSEVQVGAQGVCLAHVRHTDRIAPRNACSDSATNARARSSLWIEWYLATNFQTIPHNVYLSVAGTSADWIDSYRGVPL